jgi:hypothetical protein
MLILFFFYAYLGIHLPFSFLFRRWREREKKITSFALKAIRDIDEILFLASSSSF